MSNFYGGLKPMRVIGKDRFARHDAASTWDDGGIAVELAADAMRQMEDQITNVVDTIKQRFSEDLTLYGAHQVRDGVVDYVSNGYLDIGLIDGKLCVCFDASNDKVQMVAVWDLALLLRRASVEASNKSDRETYAALADLANALPMPVEAREVDTGERHSAAPARQSFAPLGVSSGDANAPIGRRPKGVIRNREVRSMA